MRATRTRFMAVAALSAIAIAAPVSTAGAATAPPDGQAATVTGAVYITTSPGVVFVNTNNQVATGDAVAGGQFAQ
jgi:hypothetical protein